MHVIDGLFGYVQVLAISVLVGKVVLLSFVVAPVLARNLDPAPFGSVVRAMFPNYYALGIGAASAGLISAAALAISQGATTPMILAFTLWILVLMTEWYCRDPLTPELNTLRDRLKQQEAEGAVEEGLKVKWEALHRRSVLLNSAVLVMGLCLVGISSSRL